MLRKFRLSGEIRLLETKVAKLQTVVDLGAGDGTFVKGLTNRGYHCLAVDQFPVVHWKMPEIEYRAVSLNGKNFDPDAICIDGKMPTAVVMRHSLEHVHDPVQVLNKLAKARVNYVWIVVPNLDTWLRPLLGEYWYLWDPPRHLSSFSVRTLTQAARNAEYTVVLQQYYALDELVTSFYRYLLLRFPHLPSFVPKIFEPKGALAGFSSALSSLYGSRAAIGCLLKLKR